MASAAITQSREGLSATRARRNHRRGAGGTACPVGGEDYVPERNVNRSSDGNHRAWQILALSGCTFLWKLSFLGLGHKSPHGYQLN